VIWPNGVFNGKADLDLKEKWNKKDRQNSRKLMKEGKGKNRTEKREIGQRERHRQVRRIERRAQKDE
jgi:hypothetical protein